MKTDDEFLDEIADLLTCLMNSGEMQFDENGDMIGHFDVDLRKKE